MHTGVEPFVVLCMLLDRQFYGALLVICRILLYVLGDNPLWKISAYVMRFH